MINLLTVQAARPRALLILAHGAGAPMDSEFMNGLSAGLAGQGISTVRFEFPYMAQRRISSSKRPPDPQARLLDCWQAVLRQVQENMIASDVALPLLIGGKSMGGRMASLLASDLSASEIAVAGLCCFGYPFHPPGKAGLLTEKQQQSRTGHLPSLKIPTLIVQGSRDPLGNRAELNTAGWSPLIRLHWLEDGDHDFKPRKSSGHTQAGLVAEAAVATGEFVNSLDDSSLRGK